MKTRAEWEAHLGEIELRAVEAGVGEFARATLGAWVPMAVMQGGPEIVRDMCEALIGFAVEGRERREVEQLAKAGGVQ